MITKQIYENNYKEECKDLIDWCDEIYQSKFNNMFTKLDSIYSKLHDDDQVVSYLSKISEDDLGYILIDLPMELYKSAEPLNKLIAEREFFKLKSKTIKLDIRDKVETDFQNSLDNIDLIESRIDEGVKYATAENKLMITAYDCVIKRVENQISFCKELIMGAKKIWDSRKSSYEVNPVGEVDIPDYTEVVKNQYVK